MTARLTIKAATMAEASQIELLQALALRRLARASYSETQIETALMRMGTLDRRLIYDATFYTVWHGSRLVGCGGWSFRKRLAGGGGWSAPDDAALLDPRTAAARIRSMFVHPDYAGTGIGRLLVMHAERRAAAAGFRRARLCSTPNAEGFYQRFGYRTIRTIDLGENWDAHLPAILMAKSLMGGHAPRRSGGGIEDRAPVHQSA